MKKYEINLSTIAIIALDSNKSKIIEEDNSFIIDRTTPKIIDDSCRYFGSSYLGRFEGSKNFLGGTIYKSPIIIEETREIIFFPTGSARSIECSWISLNKISNYTKDKDKTIIYFKNGTSLVFPISYSSFENQVLRASRLESILRQRKNV
ncbi:MAG: competence protein ComK [Bacilli bacterium]|nr:competence protein ComK [Bacilli bacterium]MDD4282703.1 competence protein ComK [Bacilli bacterium]MDD4718242.1 competence protein ComK [Bacilli bacterium]